MNLAKKPTHWFTTKKNHTVVHTAYAKERPRVPRVPFVTRNKVTNHRPCTEYHYNKLQRAYVETQKRTKKCRIHSGIEKKREKDTNVCSIIESEKEEGRSCFVLQLARE